MLKKFNFWNQCLQKNEDDYFGSLGRFLSENKIQLNENIKTDINDHLKQLQVRFKELFPNRPESDNWICNPFGGNISSNTSLYLLEKEKLIVLSSDNSLRARPIYFFEKS
ncbi:unnamed protein product [Acanthoscelides obtectus]|uniref:Uncharacterized protein n=1 Tax=Acanthoscelides obtectus TaxID=200917 RepID=A0A9P0L9Z8_ACAOB|nr:unnamed protein product [Acanthoscelides obtectus]CAK1646846.1 Zinc finger BED domain-containing protein 5 [Acanthoscelides obtectus]